MTRVSPWETRRAQSAAFPASIIEAAGSDHIAMVRVKYLRDANGKPYHAVEGYDARFYTVHLTVEQQAAVMLPLLGRFGTVDWRCDHDYHVTGDMLRHTPGLNERGHIPQDDQAFGSDRPGHDPVHVATGHRWDEFLIDQLSPPTTSTKAAAA